MKEVIAKNLVRYRKDLQLSQERLALLAGVSRQSINNYEKAKTLPDSDVLSKLATVLEVTLDELLHSPYDQPSIDEQALTFQFRAHASFTKKPEFTALVQGLLEDYTNLEESAELPPYAPETIPCYRKTGMEVLIEDVAKQFRIRLGIPEKPIPNLFKAVEALGLKVLRYAIPIKGFFGLSAYSARHGAFVLVNNHNITIERQLFTLAHEIGHLIFHRAEYHSYLKEAGVDADCESNDERERVADYFAGHLLVPSKEFNLVYDLIGGTSISDIVKLKSYFNVSYQVILRRLADKGKIDYTKEIIRICKFYKSKFGESLGKTVEFPPALKDTDFPCNERLEELRAQSSNKY